MNFKNKLRRVINRIPIVRGICHSLWNFLRRVKHKLTKFKHTGSNGEAISSKEYSEANMSIEAYETKKDIEKIFGGKF